jgi:hypothetical protein
MSSGSHTMKIYPPKCSSGAKASDRLQEYLMHSTAPDATAPDPRPAATDSASAARRAEGSLASVEAALIDNHFLAPPPPSHAASESSSFSTQSAARPSQLPVKERWKCFALNVLTCIPPLEQEQACEGFLQAMRELMLQPALKDSAALVVDQSYVDDSSRLQLLDGSRLEHDILPRLEELLHVMRSSR